MCGCLVFFLVLRGVDVGDCGSEREVGMVGETVGIYTHQSHKTVRHPCT